jgi:NRAMP (natural resistance-associated macrophage protein)-like metal ion transporter
MDILAFASSLRGRPFGSGVFNFWYNQSVFKITKFLKRLGPGFITGSADDDPSGIATYSQTGAMFGYAQLWIALFATPLMIGIQEMCGRIGLVTGRGLAAVVKTRYGRPVLFGAVALLLFANTVNIGADLGAMASSAGLVFGGPFVVWLVGMAVLILVLEIFVSYKVYARYLKYLTLSLLAYVVTAFVVKQDWPQILRSTLIPTIVVSRDYFFNLVAIMGTTISPYLFFWQASEENEEEIVDGKLKGMDEGVPKVTNNDLKKMRFDTAAGMIFSNIITFFIIATTASTLGRAGILSVGTATEAAAALRPLAGAFASFIFALGVVGTGLLAVPVLAGSVSYAVAETLGWRSGLYRKFKDAHGFYGVITIATLVGLLVNFTKIPPFRMLYYAAALNGVIAPVLMTLIMLIAGSKKIMGRRANGPLANTVGWIATGAMFSASLALFLIR